MKFVVRTSTLVGLATLIGFALRLPLNDTIPPRWDEGWSIAHASLSIGEILDITAADVHPPLYYLLLSAWQAMTGYELFAARYLSVLLSVTAIPLVYAVARAWSGSRRLAVLAAFFMAWLPLGVYYGAVVRMYALAPSLVLGAAYAALRIMRSASSAPNAAPPSRDAIGSVIPFAVSAAGAMLTLYHAVWALAAIASYAFGVAVYRSNRHAVRQLVAGVLTAMLIFLPWGIFAVPQFLARAAAESATNIGQQFPITYFLRQGVYDLAMAQQMGDVGVVLMTLILSTGIGVAVVRRHPLALLTLPLAMTGLTLLGVAFAARQWAFNARMLICAVPALALLLAWSLDQLPGPGSTEYGTRDTERRYRLFHTRFGAYIACGIFMIALAVVYWPTSTAFVYAKTLEVFDPYNPHTYREHIAPSAHPSDLVFFNVLSPAGFYALDRHAGDPAWSYALTWDPVIEPRERWEARIQRAAEDHDRLWIVLYRGLAGKNGDLRGWMDSNFYPAHAEWGEEEVFYGLYGVARSELPTRNVTGARWGDIVLQSAHLPEVVAPGAIVPVALTWRADAPVPRNYKVFVHAARPDGSVVAQHDAQPLNDLRPMTTWPTGEAIRDNHGLALPADYRGTLQVIVGIYDLDSGERLRTADGADAIPIGSVVVR